MSILDYFSQINYCLFSNSSKTTSTFGVAETIMYVISVFKFFAKAAIFK